MAAELFNTVAEEITDMIAASYHPVARIIKDLAAGGVLVCALFAVGVGICLFWQPESFLRILRFFMDRPWRIAVFLASLIAAAKNADKEHITDVCDTRSDWDPRFLHEEKERK